MDTWQIILAIIIVGLSIIMPIYYSSEKKKIEQLKELEKLNPHTLLKKICMTVDFWLYADFKVRFYILLS